MISFTPCGRLELGVVFSTTSIGSDVKLTWMRAASGLNKVALPYLSDELYFKLVNIQTCSIVTSITLDIQFDVLRSKIYITHHC